MKLDGKSAIVTGGASGFGEGIVRRFVDEGARVFIADVNGDAAIGLADELGDSASALKVNVTCSDQVKSMVTAVMDAVGGIDVLVNNAGVGQVPEPMEDLTEEWFDRIVEVNIKAIYRTAKLVVPVMKAAGVGAILNMACLLYTSDAADE